MKLSPLRFIHAIRTVSYIACGMFSFISLPTGCGCRPPELPLPPVGDKKYAEIERRIEQTVHPQIIFFAENLEEQPAEIQVLVALRYFRRTLSGVVPTASGRKAAVVDRWPMPTKPGRPYGAHDYITFRAGTYAVQKLTSAAEYPGAPCGPYGAQRDDYGFVAKVRLNPLGQALEKNRLLYRRLGTSLARRWDGRDPIHAVWSDDPADQDDNYKYARVYGEYLDPKS